MYLLTALFATMCASIDALLYRRGNAWWMGLRIRWAFSLVMFWCAGLVLVLLYHGLWPALLASGCWSLFILVRRYWYNVLRDMPVDHVTKDTAHERVVMAIAKRLGYHESYGGHVAYIAESALAFIVAVLITLHQGLPHGA